MFERHYDSKNLQLELKDKYEKLYNTNSLEEVKKYRNDIKKLKEKLS